MGFLKRIFSIGSKRRNRNRRKPLIDLNESGLLVVPEDAEPQEDEGAGLEQDKQDRQAARLLRSSSAHFAVVSEIDYASLPPLPHPIDRIINTPTASTSSLASRAATGTYTVKVGRRTQHTRTEFPNANPPVDSSQRLDPVTPRAKTLRQDPSVASLLDMYDAHGCLDAHAFSNTPPSPGAELGELSQGRAQTRRTGSTLRQLLGADSDNDVRNSSAPEGDISWAERFLQEQGEDSASDTSSLGLVTPTDAQTHLPTRTHIDDPYVRTNTTLSSNDASILDGNAISSMEVELSTGTELSDPEHDALAPFRFLTNKQHNMPDKEERALPALPPSSPAPSSPSRYSPSPEVPSRYLDYNASIPDSPPVPASRFSSDTSHDHIVSTPAWMTLRNRLRPSTGSRDADTLCAGPQVHHATITNTLDVQAQTGRIRGPRPPPQQQSVSSRTFSSTRNTFSSLAAHNTFPATRKTFSSSHSTQPASTIFSERSSNGSNTNLSAYTRGTEDSRRTSSRGPYSDYTEATTPTDATDSSKPASEYVDPYTPIPAARHRHSASSDSARSVVDFEDQELAYVARHPAPGPSSAARSRNSAAAPSGKPAPAVKPPRHYGQQRPTNRSGPEPDKENSHAHVPSSSAQKGNGLRSKNSKPQLPPIVPFTPIRTRSIFRPPRGKTPSPASSSELSPAAKEMMREVRKKRVYARQERVVSGGAARRVR
ncbi:hypothetical protein PLICRDRAFT_31448 [Plicaturopsis crispa FD-325 SS-3]|nr:hypothetical protein PLICRDRAFT_31448 [Plicaturopsis crispa FD-325 SS-3]